MRAVTPQLEAKLTQKLGTEPIIIVEVQWVEGQSILYSDRKVQNAEFPYPTVLRISGFDASMMLSGASDSQTVSVTLSDIDGTLKEIYRNNDVHKRPAKIYFMYSDIDLINRVLLFDGEIVTPFDWDEGKRSLTFSILSKLEDSQVGFAMEEGDFPNIPEEALGKAWPLVFGQVCSIPTVRVQASRRGYLLRGQGVVDFTLHTRLCQAIKIQCPATTAGTQDIYTQGPNNTWTVAETQVVTPSQICMKTRFHHICRIRDVLEQQQAWEYSTLSVYNGNLFPQETDLGLSIDNVTFEGHFTGNTFKLRNTIHPDRATIDQECVDVGGPKHTMVYGHDTRDWGLSKAGTSYGYVGSTGDATGDCIRASFVPKLGTDGGPVESEELFAALKSSNFIWLPPGSDVFIEGSEELLHIVSLIPGTVDNVLGYKTMIGGESILMEVPPEYYTVYETDYDGYEVVEIGFSTRLSQIEDGWSDEIYVNFTSSVGPNAADIIQWIIEKYTDWSIDSYTFGIVKAAIEKYPCNFFLTERMSAFQLIQDIAYQSRCAVYIRNDVVFLVYLSTEPNSVRTISKSDILLNTFKETLSNTDDILTTHNITWKKGGARLKNGEPLDLKIDLKYNIEKYGTSLGAWNYYTQNTYDTILKSSTFWLIRKAMSWKIIEFDLPVRHIDLDVTDCITIDVDQFSTTPVKCIIQQAQYNPDKNTVHFKCWSPIRAGETEPYYWAWPSQQPATAVWPLPGDDNGGAGYDFDVIPPEDHILLRDADNEDQVNLTTGDEHPSDLDDEYPEIICEFSEYFDMRLVEPNIGPGGDPGPDPDPPPPPGTQSLEPQVDPPPPRIKGGGGGGGGGGDEEDDEGGPCGSGVCVGCCYIVLEYWHTSFTQAKFCTPDEDCSKLTPPCAGGCRCGAGCFSCSGITKGICHVFGSAWSAMMFFQALNADGKKLADNWDCMESARLKPAKGSIFQWNTHDSTTGDRCDTVEGAMEAGGGQPSPQADGERGEGKDF